MINHKRTGTAALALMLAAVLITGYLYVNPSAFAALMNKTEPAYVSAMDKNEVMDIQIIVDESDWQNMLDTATSEEYIPATVIINGVKVENVGIRPKGNSSLSTVASSDTTDRYSFKIEFDHYINGQTWLGLDKLAVNNMQGDASYMKEYLSYDIMNYVGVDTPMYTFADISVNGEKWGFYLAVECLEDSYAKRVYGNDHGMLYKPESMGMRGEGRMNEIIDEMQGGQEQNQGQIQEQNQEIEQEQEQERTQFQFPNDRGGDFFGGGMGGMSSGGISLVYSGSDTSSYSAIFDNSIFDATETDYKRFVEALEKLSTGEDLEGVVDVEATLKYFAAHTVVVNLDSYVSNMAHNYYIYEEDGQLTILPWDYNLAFGGFQMGGAADVVNFPIDTPVSGTSLDDRPLLGKLLEVPEYMELYHSYLQDIVDGYFNSGQFEQTVDLLDNLISPYIENDPSAFYDYDAYKAAVPEIKKLGLLRAESIEGQLAGDIPSTTSGQSADSSNLVDSSDINFNALGSQGGGGGGGGMGGGMQGLPGGFDMESMQKAMEIITGAGENELTEEQIAELHGLGITDEQIEQFKNMAQGGFGNIRQNDRQNDRQAFQGQPNQGRQNPNQQNQLNQSSQTAISTTAENGSVNADIIKWVYFGCCCVFLLAGLLFTTLFRRRRAF